MQGNFKAKEALALLTTTTIDQNTLDDFAKAVAEEFSSIGYVEIENTVRAVLVGIGLHAVKQSLPHGKFEAWKKANLTQGKIWTEATALKNASLYMRLAIAVVEELRPSRKEMAALATTGTLSLSVSTQDDNVKRFVDRVEKLIGERSLNELLADYGLKNSSSAPSSAKTPALPADDDTLAEDAGQLLINFDHVLLNPEHIKRFSPQQLDEMERQLSDRLEKFRALKTQLLNPTA